MSVSITFFRFDPYFRKTLLSKVQQFSVCCPLPNKETKEKYLVQRGIEIRELRINFFSVGTRKWVGFGNQCLQPLYISFVWCSPLEQNIGIRTGL